MRAVKTSQYVASGHSHKGMIEATVRLDEETFEVIRQRATDQGTSFAEQVRLLIEWGLEVDAGAFDG